jgi:hypothetical protein
MLCSMVLTVIYGHVLCVYLLLCTIPWFTFISCSAQNVKFLLTLTCVVNFYTVYKIFKDGCTKLIIFT